MTTAVRTVAMAIAAILLMHAGGMAVDPMALHAPAAGEVAHHAGHAAVSADDLTMVQDAWSCIDGEGVATSTKVPLAPMVFVAVMPVGALPVPLIEGRMFSHWVPPPLDAAELRVWLQVFLN